MDSLSVLMRGMLSQDNEKKIFDWNRAARRIKEVHPKIAKAGLADDWDPTVSWIYTDQNGAIKDDYTVLGSTWAIPQLEMDGEIEDCYLMQSECPDWNVCTNWPESALKILEEVPQQQ